MSLLELLEERKVVYQILILFGLMCKASCFNVFQVPPNINIKGVSAKMQNIQILIFQLYEDNTGISKV